MKLMGYEIVINVMMNVVSKISLPSNWANFDTLLDAKVKESELKRLCEVLEGMIREDNIPADKKVGFRKSLESLALKYVPISNDISGLLALL